MYVVPVDPGFPRMDLAYECIWMLPTYSSASHSSLSHVSYFSVCVRCVSGRGFEDLRIAVLLCSFGLYCTGAHLSNLVADGFLVFIESWVCFGSAVNTQPIADGCPTAQPIITARHIKVLHHSPSQSQAVFKNFNI